MTYSLANMNELSPGMNLFTISSLANKHSQISAEDTYEMLFYIDDD